MTSRSDREAASIALFATVSAYEPGCSAAVAIDGEIVFRESFGAARLTPLVPMTNGTLVEVASTTKQFTATAILMLEDRGLVDANEPVNRYLPDLPAWASTVTVSHLIHHVSGIPDYLHPLVKRGHPFEQPASDGDTIEYLLSVDRLDAEPGAAFTYSNSNYVLLGHIVHAATGHSLAEFLAAEVFGPLGLAARLERRGRPLVGMAHSYARRDDGWDPVVHPWTQLGDGGLVTTPTDLVRWASEYWSPTVVSLDAHRRRFDTPSDGGTYGRYGYGLYERVVHGRRTWRHSGEWEAFVTSFVLVPDLRAAACVTSCSYDSPIVDFDDEISDRLLDIWLTHRPHISSRPE